MIQKKFLFFLTLITIGTIFGCTKDGTPNEIKSNNTSILIESNFNGENTETYSTIPIVGLSNENLKDNLNSSSIMLDFSGVTISKNNNMLKFEKNLDLINETKKVHKMTNSDFNLYNKNIDATIDIINNHLTEEEKENLLNIYNEHIENNSRLTVVELGRSNINARGAVPNLSISLSVGVQPLGKLWVQQNSNFNAPPTASKEDDAVALGWDTNYLIAYDSNPKLSIKWSNGTSSTSEYSTFDSQNITSTKFDEYNSTVWAKSISYGITLKTKRSGSTNILTSYAQPKSSTSITGMNIDLTGGSISWQSNYSSN
ncbi:MAG: hypothetical protein ACRCYE_04285 [Sarcina sp.]